MDWQEALALARQQVIEACERCQTGKLAEQITIKFNPRFTSRAGDANYRSLTIRLSQPLWQRMAPAERRETVIHEACHLIAYFHHGSQIAPHGPEWQSMMIRCGLEPKRCHQIERSDLRRQVRRREVYCGCGKREITQHRYTRMKKGHRYMCRVCQEMLTLVSPQETKKNAKSSKSPTPPSSRRFAFFRKRRKN
ncbi:SprT domain-containing protein [Planctomycetales bacterium 10988]|nr:SprT domain-containing protein [Planctomycetales bacterium 10988]